MSDFFSFRKMITPIIIQILFWLGVIVSVIAGIIMIVESGNSYYGSDGTMVLGGLLMIFLGPLAVRIYCELLIVIFRINETLTDIRNVYYRPAQPAQWQAPQYPQYPPQTPQPPQAH